MSGQMTKKNKERQNSHVVEDGKGEGVSLDHSEEASGSGSANNSN